MVYDIILSNGAPEQPVMNQCRDQGRQTDKKFCVYCEYFEALEDLYDLLHTLPRLCNTHWWLSHIAESVLVFWGQWTYIDLYYENLFTVSKGRPLDFFLSLWNIFRFYSVHEHLHRSKGRWVRTTSKRYTFKGGNNCKQLPLAWTKLWLELQSFNWLRDLEFKLWEREFHLKRFKLKKRSMIKAI